MLTHARRLVTVVPVPLWTEVPRLGLFRLNTELPEPLRV